MHVFCCLQEVCPFCGNQMASCNCIYEHLQLFDKKTWTEETAFLPPAIYKKGPTDAHMKEWHRICQEKGRFPYVFYPLFCAYCGEPWPEMFMDKNSEWDSVVEPRMRREVLCRDCYERIKEKVTHARAAAK